jgi:hypothetical protein
MKSKKWPPIRKTINHGQPAFVVDARINGKGERKFFPSAGEARSFADACRVRRANEGAAAMVNADLAAFGWTVARAIEFALEHLRKAAKAKPLKDAVADFTAGKAGKSDAYKRDLKGILDAFNDALPAATTASVTTAEINEFLTGLHPVTANNRRRVLSVFFNWCVLQGFREDNPAEGAAVAKVSHGTPGILTP